MTVTDLGPFQKIDIIDLLIRGIGMRKIANGQGLSLEDVKAVAEACGHPDEQAMRRAKAELKAEPKMPDGPPTRKPAAPRRGRTNPSPRSDLTELEDNPTIAVVHRLTAAVRDQDTATIAALISGFDLDARAELVITMAAIIAPDTDLGAALEWVDLPPGEWSPETISRENGRWESGARDHTAATAHRLGAQA